MCSKVLIADLFSPVAIMEMQGLGLEVTFNKDLNEATLSEAMASSQPHILVVKSDSVVGAAMIDANPKLRLVVVAGASAANVDVSHCARKGIFVANCPNGATHALAELTVGLMVSVNRRIVEADRMLKEGKWDKELFS